MEFTCIYKQITNIKLLKTMKQNQDNRNILEQSLLDYDKIEKMIARNSEDTVKNILGESLKKSLKNILAEANDEFDEEEDDLDLGTEETDGMDDIESDTDLNDEEEIDEPEETEVDDVELGDDMDLEDDLEGGEDEEDFDFDEFKTGEDEYDLTNNSIEDVIKIFKRIDGDDSVIVKKLDDDKIEVKDNETEAEYVIDLESDGDDDAIGDFGFDGDDDLDSNLSEEFINEYDMDFGMDDGSYYDDDDLDDKLRDFNLPSDIEEYNPTDDDLDEFDDEFDDDLLDESDEFEIELDGDDMLGEKPMTQSIGANRRAGKMSQTRKAYAPGKATNRDGAKLIANEQKLKRIYNAKLSEMKRKHEAEKKEIIESVNKYKETLKLFSNKIKESAVLNNNLAKYVKLISENTTTKDEKLSILRRFSNQGNSIESSNKLYESINKELKDKVHPEFITLNDKVSASGSKKINEQVIYEDKGQLGGVLNLMNRIEKL